MNPKYFYICTIIVAVLGILAYSPIVLAPGIIEPVLFGLPRTLWAGLLIYIAIVLLTVVAIYVHPDREKIKREES